MGWSIPPRLSVGRGGRVVVACPRVESRSYQGAMASQEEQEVNIVTTRFGNIPVSESDLIRIPDGLIGFRSQTQFLLFADREVIGLTWLQSATTPDLAFALIPPSLAVDDYRLDLRPGDRTALELEDEESALIYVIMNRGESGGLTVNLQGPLVLNPARRIGRQLVLTSSRYSVRFALGGEPESPSIEEAASSDRPNVLPGPVALRATA